MPGEDGRVPVQRLWCVPGRPGHMQRIALEDATFSRLRALIKSIARLLGPCVAHSAHSDTVLRLLVQVYNAVTAASVLMTAPKGTQLLLDSPWPCYLFNQPVKTPGL